MSAGPWGDFVDLRAEIGLDARWSADLSRWDVDTWASGRWVWGLSADWQPVELGTLLSVDAQLGSGDLVTPVSGSSGSVTLWNRDGTYAPASSEWWLGAQLRIRAAVNGGPHEVIFWGTIGEPVHGGTVGVPELTLTAYDALSLWASARTEAGPGNATQTVVQRLHAVADAIQWPGAGCDFAPDATSLAPDDARNALDVATRAVSSAHGIIWADPADPYTVIRYRPAGYLAGLDAADAVLAISAGDPPPSSLALARPTDLEGALRLGDVGNVIECADLAGLYTAYAEDAASMARYGRQALSPVTDLALSTQAELDAWAAAELARHATPRGRVEPVTVTVYDPGSAEAAGLRLLDVIHVGDTARLAAPNSWGFAAAVTGLSWSATSSALDIGVTAYALDAITSSELAA